MRKTRLDILKNFLLENGFSHIKELSKYFDVSEMTIRRDLKILQSEGFVEIHGGVVVSKKIKNYNLRKIKNVHEKEKIAEIAVKLLEDRRFIYLGGCTTNLMIARKLSSMELDHNIHVITNDPHIVIELGRMRKASIFVLPGLYDNANETIIHHDIEDIKRYVRGIEIAFLGITGISTDGSFYNADPFEAILKKEIIKIAKEVAFVADHTKFGKKFPWKVCSFGDVDYLITDQKPESGFMKLAYDNNLNLLFYDYPKSDLNLAGNNNESGEKDESCNS